MMKYYNFGQTSSRFRGNVNLLIVSLSYTKIYFLFPNTKIHKKDLSELLYLLILATLF
jgi:hypothetical protein